MIPLFKLSSPPNLAEKITELFISNNVGYKKVVEKFEEELSKFLGVKWVLALNSEFSAFLLLFHILLEPGDEVLTTPLVCTTVNWPILFNRNHIKWVDVDEKGEMDYEDCRMKLSPRTKAVIVTHPFGNVANINELQDLHVIEDCTNAFGAEYSNRNKVGNSPNLCVFSFQTVRFASCVEGGAITFPDTEKGRELYERIKKLRYFGIKGSIQEDISEAGGKFCMSDLNATIGLCNMQTLDQQLKTCADNVSYYCLLLHNDRIRPLPCLGNCWLFMLRVRERDKFIEHMRDGGVMASPVHRRNDVYSCVEKYKTTLHGLDKFEREYVAIPCGWWLSEEERELILKLMNAF